jgi:alpha,alpha-trehalase
MLANFVSMIERYGHIPNGTRTYYLSRSQPPFLALMMDLSTTHDPATDRQRLAALKAEHAYWVAGASCLASDGACQHVVKMPDGSLLNRYWDARDTPRDESYAEDVATTAAAAPRPVNRDLRAGAESGWDYSSRWLKDGKTLATIHATDIVPVDLNSLMWNLEKSIARRCTAAGDTACGADFDKQADARKAAMARYLWSAKDQRFADWDRSTGKPTTAISAALLYPLFVGLATPAQADATARLTQAQLLAPGGLRTTTVHTGQQWDEPNGWAPLLWIGVQGLDRYGKTPLADDLAGRWIRTVSTFYACTGRMVEKYDVDSGKAGGGGEYPVQDGFGWTNGVTRALLDRPGTAAAVVQSCPAS